jgi:hypothetical protein
MTVPELVRALGIRAALGVGLGLLLANAFPSAEKRSAVGWTLLTVGAVMGAGLAYEIFGRPRSFTLAFGTQGDGREARSAPEGPQRLQDAFAPEI